MDIPAPCWIWKEKMDAAEATRYALANLAAEVCIDDGACQIFFEHLASEGPPTDSSHAFSQCRDVVKKNWESLTCCGREVQASLFQTVVRLRPKSMLIRCLSDTHRHSFLNAMGLDPDELRQLSNDETQLVMDQYKYLVDIGGDLNIAWVADFGEMGHLIDQCSVLIDRLGLKGWNERACIVIVYRRNQIQKLHVPRAFDGIGNSQFFLIEDCTVLTGKTKPLRDASVGLAEAIHRNCEVRVDSFEIRTVL